MLFVCIDYSANISNPLVIDCGIPLFCKGVAIDAFNSTRIGAVIILQCEESGIQISTVCGINGEWIPNPFFLCCGESPNGSLIPDPADVDCELTQTQGKWQKVSVNCGSTSGANLSYNIILFLCIICLFWWM